MAFLPRDDRSQHLFDLSVVADEIIVYDEHGSTKAAFLHSVELSEELLGGFCPLDMPEHLDDVTELAVVGTAPGILEGHAVISAHIDEIKTGHRRVGNLRFPGVPVQLLRLTGIQIGKKTRQGCLLGGSRLLQY